MTYLFKNGDRMAIQTNAEDEYEFMLDVAALFSGLIDDGEFEWDWDFQFQFWLPAVADICCAYRGHRSRTLMSPVSVYGVPGPFITGGDVQFEREDFVRGIVTQEEAGLMRTFTDRRQLHIVDSANGRMVIQRDL